MKEKFSKRILSLFIAAVFCLTTFAVTGASVDKVYADDYEYELPSTIEKVYYPNNPEYNAEPLASEPLLYIDMESVTYSKEGVAQLVRREYGDPEEGPIGGGDYAVEILKAGTTVLTFQARINEGQREEKTMTVKVLKYTNPCKTFKVGKRSYLKRYNSKIEYRASKKVSGKLVITPKTGWKIISIRKYIGKQSIYKTIKNNRKVTLAKGDLIDVRLQKKGTGMKVFLTLERK